jgi:hypothetical protein
MNEDIYYNLRRMCRLSNQWRLTRLSGDGLSKVSKGRIVATGYLGACCDVNNEKNLDRETASVAASGELWITL